MGIYVGNSEIQSVYIGTTPVKEVYVGTTKIRPTVQPITTAGIYWSSDLGLISLSSDGSTRITVADKNLGATQVFNKGDASSQAKCGNYYQWGNNYPFPRGQAAANTRSTKPNVSSYGPGNYYSSNQFVVGFYGDWASSTNNNLWGGTGSVANRQGPCSSGYHIPMKSELESISTIFSSLGLGTGWDTWWTYLKLPTNTGRIRPDNTYYSGDYWFWCSDAYNNDNANMLQDGSPAIYSIYKSYGFCIRPFKNDAVQPDTSRTKLN